MIIPLGDAPNPRGFTAWVTWLLIAANVAIYLWMLPLGFERPAPDDPTLRAWVDALSHVGADGVARLARPGRELIESLTRYDLVLFEHGFRPGAPAVDDLFSAMFLHAGLSHLFGNMLFLWIYGDNIEHRLGRLGYLALYLGGGVAATLAFASFAANPAMPLVGASGAISAVLGAYLAFFPHNDVRLWLVFFPFISRTVSLPAWVVLGAYVVFDNLLPWISGGDGGVAHGAHLGGFMAGYLAGSLRRAPTRAGADDLLARALAAAEAGDVVLAYNLASRAARSGDPQVAPRAVALIQALRRW